MVDQSKIRQTLFALRDEIEALRLRSAADQKPIALDQQSVGRLSRMDSMQVQAMDQAKDARRAIELKSIAAALTRLDEGEYGYCVSCGEAIAPARLEQSPASPFCVECAKN
ncbi:MAG: molecular chaperone DnaK [Robiginitomaculum sp.]|nr:MAG: molecular chaperone DnaK [Robiginitomaculum sp.]